MAGPIGARPGRPKCWDHVAGIPLLVKRPGRGSEGIKCSDCVLNSSLHSSSFSQGGRCQGVNILSSPSHSKFLTEK